MLSPTIDKNHEDSTTVKIRRYFVSTMSEHLEFGDGSGQNKTVNLSHGGIADLKISPTFSQ